MTPARIDILVQARAVIGEAPFWSGREPALYWIDVKAPALFRTDPETGDTRRWTLPAEIGGYALLADRSGAIVALRSGIFALAFASGDLDRLAGPPFDPRTHRFNEGDCDPAGRLWLGTMFDPLPGVKAEPRADHLYAFTLAGGLVRHAETAFVANGFAWSPDGGRLYLADSRAGRIDAVAFDAARGRLGLRQPFAAVPSGLGVPDGGAVDAEGFYWSAIHGGSCLHRYAPDGRLDRRLPLPVRYPTMMAFGGGDLATLFVTSATHGEPGSPQDGAVLRLRPGVRGEPRPLFGETRP
ncbi:SMP-30/gluconolactonase/LRE family protein [Methylobacterium nodulans]|uniref:SMP-30/Gluconolaconase/LRE domain protein n=1 Tax=Methylobacterium nodulans (strain LMG 21967 / CNCM I-2342 / ORS 2060) TaxID=460265 RepID=B8IC73_METNO|nr:SMP-30/gluconolactonase/LRE family protein [Methylobacterium nodulans]ACL55461.1 SMP-30/Gluconolaconase/LRE domain protein [Methylobacterium nodulans ORS 2060]